DVAPDDRRARWNGKCRGFKHIRVVSRADAEHLFPVHLREMVDRGSAATGRAEDEQHYSRDRQPTESAYRTSTYLDVVRANHHGFCVRPMPRKKNASMRLFS